MESSAEQITELKVQESALNSEIAKLEATPVTAPPAPVANAAVRVTLRHPLTKDTKIVDGTPEALIPPMGQGYQQVAGV